MKRQSLTLSVFVFVLLLTISGQAQTPTPTPAGDKDVVVINTNLIQIDVTVTDKDGKILTDLKPEDFEVFENGELQPLTNFSFVQLQPEKSGQKNSGEKTDKAFVPGVASALRPEQVRRTIALVVDDLGLSFASTRWTKSALKKFVDEQMQPGDLVAIIRTGSGVGALQQFTTDKRLLYAAIERLRWNPNGRGGVGSFSPIEPNLSEQLSGVVDLTGSDPEEGKKIQNIAGAKEEREFQRDAAEFQEGIFAAGTLGAVNYIMRGMGQIPGRKAIMLFSDGFKLFSRKGANSRIIDGLRNLSDLANRTGTTIYTLDPRGLDTPMLSAEDNTYGLSSAQVADRLEERSRDFVDTQQSLRYLAELTGGFAVVNSNNLNKGLDRVLNDQKGYYLLGYQPDGDTFDAAKRRFNKLEVRVKRPNLNVRYRSGFFGVTDAALKPKTPTEQLVAALTSPFAAREIDVRLTSLFAADFVGAPIMRSLVFVHGKDLTFKDDGDGWQKAEFDVSALTFDENGNVIDQLNRKQNIRARDVSLEEVKKNGFVCFFTFPVSKPGSYLMRVVFRDEASARIGSASQYIEVPDIKKKRFSLSGIFLNRIEEQQNTNNEFLTTLINHRNTAMRRFRAKDQIRFDLTAYHANRSKGQPQLVSQFKIFRDGVQIFASRERPVVLNQQTADSADISGGFKLTGNLPPGDYVLQVTVKDLLAKEKRSIASQWIDFELVQ